MADGTLEREFARSSDDFLVELDRLRDLEQQKRAMTPGDPARSELAVRVEEVTLGLFGRSQYQTHLAVASEATDGAGRRATHVVLRDWRDAERRLREANEAFRGAAAETAAFRDEYLRSMAGVGRPSEA